MLLLALSLGVAAQPATPDFDRAMGSVVLLVTSLDGDMSGYGSGIVIDDKGLVLTNLHVLDKARAVYALPHDPERPSYAAVDGGLQRLVFERENELIPVSVVRGDPVLDLAVVRLNKPARVVVAKLQTKEPAVGDAVFALGHPEQNFWTVTRGQVSGRHQGFLQHDAAVNKGNSGGPLINAAGEVVGINTSFIKGAPGIYYARPVALAGKLVDVVKAPLVLDRSTPEKAVMSCARARELGDPSYSQCIHWGSHYAFFRDMVVEILENKSPLVSGVQHSNPRLHGGVKSSARATLRAWLERGDGRPDVWTQRYGPFALAWHISDDPAEVGRLADAFVSYVQDGSRGGRPPKIRPVAATRSMKREELARAIKLKSVPQPSSKEAAAIQEIKVGTGLKVGPEDVAALRKTLKMGLRVERSMKVSPDRAWVEVAGRNLDGTPYRFSMLLSREEDGWREHLATWSDVLADRVDPPLGFAPSIDIGFVPAMLSAMFGGLFLAMHAVIADPEGVSQDVDFEHVWPLMLDLARAAPAGADRIVSFTSESLELSLSIGPD